MAGISAAQYDRVVFSGMGASLFALYPAWLIAVRAGIPAWWIDSAELLNEGRALITARTLLVLVSQSGRSAEILSLLEALEGRRPAGILGITNDPESPLGQAADQVILLHSGAEYSVSTRSYINTLAVAQIVVQSLTGATADLSEFERSADALDQYLGPTWNDQVAAIAAAIGRPDRLVILGRGAALATAWQAALITKEAAKVHAEGMNAAQFRHGPLELADPRLTAIVLEGGAATADLNRRMARDLLGFGVRVLWVGSRPPTGVTILPIPTSRDISREIVDIVPLEIVTVCLAQAGGFVPGEFRNGGKITTTL
jgi:glucosamine--fructose-6-phosphate aminotransferase (isomerizing)